MIIINGLRLHVPSDREPRLESRLQGVTSVTRTADFSWSRCERPVGPRAVIGVDDWYKMAFFLKILVGVLVDVCMALIFGL